MDLPTNLGKVFDLVQYSTAADKRNILASDHFDRDKGDPLDYMDNGKNVYLCKGTASGLYFRVRLWSSDGTTLDDWEIRPFTQDEAINLWTELQDNGSSHNVVFGKAFPDVKLENA